jgi:hypothetical protein
MLQNEKHDLQRQCKAKDFRIQQLNVIFHRALKEKDAVHEEKNDQQRKCKAKDTRIRQLNVIYYKARKKKDAIQEEKQAMVDQL